MANATHRTLKQIFSAKRGKSGPFAVALLLQVLLLAAAAAVVVFVPSSREEPVFVAERTIFLPQQELDHRMAVAEFEQSTTSPVSIERVSIEAMTDHALPPLPEIPAMDFNPSPVPAAVSAQAMFGQSGIEGLLQDLSTEVSSVAFLGIEDQAARIVIVFDISTTVTNSVVAAGLSMETIRSETIALIEQLNANTLFGLIQHSRNFDTFRDFLLPATVDNKAEAVSWMQTHFRTDGMGRGWRRYEGRNGIEAVLEVAFNMEPDVMFILSDGSYWRNEPSNQRVPYRDIFRLVERRQSERTAEARLHVIGFGVRSDDRRDFRSLASRNGGTFREF